MDEKITSAGLSVRQAAFIGVASMVGAGIFSLLGAAGEVAGSAVWLSFLLAGVSRCCRATRSQRSARYPSAGGLLEYVVRGYGNGHVTGVIAWLVLRRERDHHRDGRCLVRQLRERRIAEDPALATKAFAALLIVAMTVLNSFGSQAVARVQPVVVVVVIGILGSSPSRRSRPLTSAVAGTVRYPPLRHPGERGADLLRVPRLRRHHLHRKAAHRTGAQLPSACISPWASRP